MQQQPLLYKYFAKLGINNTEKIPTPNINRILLVHIQQHIQPEAEQTAAEQCQWIILNRIPNPVKEIDNTPVINTNFFILIRFNLIKT